MASHKLPLFVIIWMVVSFAVVLWDASYVMLRPQSMEGGSLAWLYGPYQLYILHDERYANQGDSFVLSQAIVNLVEIAVGIGALLLHMQGSPRCNLWAHASLSMTLGKTILYFTMEAVEGWANTWHGSIVDMLLYFIIPSATWLIFPLWGMFATGAALLPPSKSKSS